MDNKLPQPRSNYKEIYPRVGEEFVGTLECLEIGDQVAVIFSLAKGEHMRVIIDPSEVDLLKDLSALIGQKVGLMKTGILGRDFRVRKIHPRRKKIA